MKIAHVRLCHASWSHYEDEDKYPTGINPKEVSYIYIWKYIDHKTKANFLWSLALGQDIVIDSVGTEEHIYLKEIIVTLKRSGYKIYAYNLLTAMPIVKAELKDGYDKITTFKDGNCHVELKRSVGRPKQLKHSSVLDGREELIKGLINKGMSKLKIAKKLNVSRQTLHAFIKAKQL